MRGCFQSLLCLWSMTRRHYQKRLQRWGVRHVWTQFAKNIRRDMPSCGALFGYNHNKTQGIYGIMISIFEYLPWKATGYVFLSLWVVDVGAWSVVWITTSLAICKNNFWEHFVCGASLLLDSIQFVIYGQDCLESPPCSEPTQVEFIQSFSRWQGQKHNVDMWTNIYIYIFIQNMVPFVWVEEPAGAGKCEDDCIVV